MAENPISTPLPADLPTNWTYGQTIAPSGAEAGLSEQHGYNYLMRQVNSAQEGVNALGEALVGVPTLVDGKVPVSQLPAGTPNGVAGLDSSGRVPSAQLPDLDYDPAGSANAVQANLTAHTNNKANPHDVTVQQIGAAAVSHNHSAGDITSGTLSSARLPVVPISKGGTGKTTAAEALAALGGVSAASLAAYDKTIKGAYPIATGNSVTAGDVVDVVDGEVTRSVVAEANVENCFYANSITCLAITKLNTNYSVIASHPTNNNIIVDVIDNFTGEKLFQDIYSYNYANSATEISIARLDDSRFVITHSYEGSYGNVGIGTVNAANVTFVDAGYFKKGSVRGAKLIALSDADVFAVYNGGNLLEAQVFTISNNVVTEGTAKYCAGVFVGTTISAALLPNDNSGNKRVCVCFADANDSYKGKAVIATINSSNAVTWGSVVTFSDKIESVDVCADGEDSVVFYRSTATGTTTSRIKNLSISGTVITPSTTETETNIAAYPNIENISGKFIVAGTTYDASTSTAYVATKSGNGFVLSSPVVFNAKGASTYLSMAAIDNNHVILAYADNGNSKYLTSTILEVDGNQIAGGFTVNSTQAIALESGEAGQNIEVIFAGTTAADFVTEGQKIPSEGVYGYGPAAGWLNVIPYWAKEAGAKIVMGSYVGTGKNGASNPCSLTFNFEPKFVMLTVQKNAGSGDMFLPMGGYWQAGFLWHTGTAANRIGSTSNMTYFNVNKNTLSWYSAASPAAQLNDSSRTYEYVAIG